MAQADTDTRFYGTIHRGSDSDGHPVIPDRIEFNNGFVCAQASDQWELGERLDELVLIILDYGLNDNAGVNTEINGEQFFLN